MKRRRYVIGILLCVTVLLQAQDSVKSFDEFLLPGWIRSTVCFLCM